LAKDVKEKREGEGRGREGGRRTPLYGGKRGDQVPNFVYEKRSDKRGESHSFPPFSLGGRGGERETQDIVPAKRREKERRYISNEGNGSGKP